jgi:hypothetical protein
MLVLWVITRLRMIIFILHIAYLNECFKMSSTNVYILQ